jgi:hypothetical protein
MCEVKWSSWSLHASYINVVNPIYLFSHESSKGKPKLSTVTKKTSWNSNGRAGAKVKDFTEFADDVYNEGIDKKVTNHGTPAVALGYTMTLFAVIKVDKIYYYVNFLISYPWNKLVNDLDGLLNTRLNIEDVSLTGYVSADQMIFRYFGPSGLEFYVSNYVEPHSFLENTAINWFGIQAMPYIYFE